jgi:four helix bundle protein
VAITNESFRVRTKAFAIAVFKFIETIPVTTSTRIMNYQLGKSASSVGANFRAFCRGRSRNERFSKICIAVEEADETEYWLDIYLNLDHGEISTKKYLYNESLELVKITSSIKEAFSP